MPSRHLSTLFQPLARLLQWDGLKLSRDKSLLQPDLTDDSAETQSVSRDERQDVFDAEWYLTKYPDIAAAGVEPFEHFVCHGEAENRDPSPAFSTTYYRECFMEGDTSEPSPLRHFIKIGRARGYNPAPDPLDKYASHLMAKEQSYGLELPELLRHIDVMPIKPHFVVYQHDEDADGRSDVLVTQIYPHWTLCHTKEEIALQDLDAESSRFFIWLEGGDALHSSALYSFASAINGNNDVDVVYGDEDEIRDDGVRLNPFYKPDWSPDYLEACNYLGSCTCVRGSIAAETVAQSEGQYDFILRSVEHAKRIVHVRNVLAHRTQGLDRPKTSDQIRQEIIALDNRLKRTNRQGIVTPVRPDIGCYEMRTRYPETPLISVVIPTAGRCVDIDGRIVDLISNCLEMVQARSTYKNLEFIVVDNGDIDDARRSALELRGVRFITYSDPSINVARKLNLGAAVANGEFLLLLNDDVEPLTPDWIDRMLEHFDKPHVGVVGAKLYFEDMTTQHVGVILNGGNPDHPRTRQSPRDDGYFFSSCATRNFVAVTGAVMLTRTSLFHQAGGYTEALAIAFNDVDFCLKLRELGFQAVYAPQAELIHYESLSRTRMVDDNELRYFHTRWAKIVTDPFYNEEQLTLLPASYEVQHNRRALG